MTATARRLGQEGEPASVSDTFLQCLARARHERWPFDYWLLKDAIPAADLEAVLALPLAPPENPVFSGRRENNNAQRIFFNSQAQQKFAVCKRIVDGFDDARVRSTIESVTGTRLADARLRIEYCQDGPGFWLEPHTDILVKKFTMLVYLMDNPELATAGTDIHEGPPDFRFVATAPYGKNLGVVFIPSGTSWHGVGHHPIRALRKSLIINFVSRDWRAVDELA